MNPSDAPSLALHPDAVLFGGEASPVWLPSCDHYAGAEKFLGKALALQSETATASGPVFDLTADCEDGAAVGREAAHAEMVATLIGDRANRYARVGVRIHDITHPHWKRDLEIIVPRAGERLAYVTAPKVRSLGDVVAMAAHVDSVARGARPIPLHVLIETHGALRAAFDIAAHPRVECLAFGLLDFVSAHDGAIPPDALASPGQFDHPLVRRAKLEIAAAAHAHGKVPAHNVSTALRERERVRADAKRAAAEFGYTRMWSVHPDQIAPIVEAMAPGHAEVERAARVLLAAQDAGWGPTSEDGTLHDRASYRLFWSLLRRAHAAGVVLPPAAEARFFGGTR